VRALFGPVRTGPVFEAHLTHHYAVISEVDELAGGPSSESETLESVMRKKTPNELLEANLKWSRERIAADLDYFRRLAALQTPEYLWIGCSDSRVPANVITGLEPGEVFVHRNVANIVYPADLNCMSVLQFAVESLQVKHIIVCGHYGCGGVRAAFDGSGQVNLIDHWLAPVRDLFRQHEHELSCLLSDEARIDRVCELNVLSQVRSVCNSPIVMSAWERKQELSVHGWIYGLNDGRLRDLGCTYSSNVAMA
jgi:carbonic anhydrase